MTPAQPDGTPYRSVELRQINSICSFGLRDDCMCGTTVAIVLYEAVRQVKAF